MLYWNCCLIRTCCLVITQENFKSFWINLSVIFADPIWRRKFLYSQSSVPYNGIWRRIFEKKLTNNSFLFWKKKHGKNDDRTMTMVWIMENMVITPWSCHESWRLCQEIWLPCRHLGMIMTMFRHDHGIIKARSWYGSHVFPTREALEWSPTQPICFKIQLK